MSEYRQNVTNGEWVIISSERANRPADYKATGKTKFVLPEHSPNCPFCKGNEDECQTPVYEVKDENGWKLRVVPNIYAAVSRPDEITTKPLPREHVSGIHLKADGYGVAEVIIESPKHNANLAFMEKQEVYEVIKAYRERFNAFYNDHNIAVATIFKNYGSSAGASLEHPHSQIIATHVLPAHITDNLAYARRAFNSYGTCIFCDLIDKEIKAEEKDKNENRVVIKNENFLAFCPFASKNPYEVHIFPLPHKHSALFGTISEEEMQDLADILPKVLKKISNLLDNPDYNYYVITAPNSDKNVRFYHWHIEITPRLTRPAGFELGTGIYINTTEPEFAAKQLRDTEI